MNRVHVLVEGQTEEAFVGRSLRPYLWGFDVDLSPKLIVTRRIVAGPDRKGGVVSWRQVERDLKLLLNDSAATAVTTMLDYYGLPADVPGMMTRPAAPAREGVLHVEKAIEAHMANPRFRTHLSLHEFEALLYTDPDACGRYLGDPRVTRAMAEAVSECGGPELVNDDAATAPSKRLLAVYPTYQKTLDGPAVAESIGLVKMRTACPHFGAWMAWLESLGP